MFCNFKYYKWEEYLFFKPDTGQKWVLKSKNLSNCPKNYQVIDIDHQTAAHMVAQAKQNSYISI